MTLWGKLVDTSAQLVLRFYEPKYVRLPDGSLGQFFMPPHILFHLNRMRKDITHEWQEFSGTSWVRIGTSGNPVCYSNSKTKLFSKDKLEKLLKKCP